jgi:pimeloyl-ACP methyl ester carboxylesterase
VPYANLNGIDLYYEEHGKGPPVVFAHGAGGNHASWYQQVPFFARHYRTITIDQRGFGTSDDVNELGRGSFVADLAALLDSLGIEKTALVAQSMGGSACMGFTVRHPERVRALVMADTLAGITLPEPLRARQQTNAEATRDLPQLERVVSRNLPVRDPAKAELYLQIASLNRSNANRFNMPGSPAAPITMDEVTSAAKQVPMLFMVGQEDILQPPEIVKAASELVPGAQFVLVPDSGHSVYFEQPEVFNHEVHRFLAKHLVLE